MNKDKTLEIIAALSQGGIVVANRGSGKSRALAMLVRYDPKGVAVVNFHAQKKALIKHMIDLGLSESAAQKKVMHSSSPILNNEAFVRNSNIYVDELYMSGYTGPFKAAVTSYPFSVTVIG